MQERDDKRLVMQAELGDIVISSDNLIEVEHVGPFHDEVISRMFEDALAYALMIGGDNPTSYKEVINSKETNKLMIAMKEELESLHMNKTGFLWSYQKGKRLLNVSGFFSVKNLYLQKMRNFLKSN